ncbi:ABC transporter permease subunit [Paenibacillus sp. LHD-38]|nr:ABC transporter permease subunit [Paenibacillus sp. LHD-38]MDQ8738143.1 ABC transporter permease subunit [Paenibacillus sp. LHD-38]
MNAVKTDTSSIREKSYPKYQIAWKQLRRQIYPQTFVLLGILFLIIFSYIPMFGILMAFKDYKISTGVQGIFTSDWVGLKYFSEFVSDYRFIDLVRNTLIISVLKIIFAFPIPILFAIMLNELKGMAFKRIVQTVSYFPHFISWVVVSGLAFVFLSAQDGIVNMLFMKLNIVDKPLDFLTDPDMFWGLAVGSAVWKEAGWWTIIFLAAIAGINPSLYEAAQIDGAGRLKRIWHITLPSIQGAVVVVLVLSIGSLLGGGLVGSNFEQAFLLGNSVNSDKSEIVQTYAFKVGLAEGRFAYAAAIDLVQSVLSVFLIFFSNFIAKRLSGQGLF